MFDVFVENIEMFGKTIESIISDGSSFCDLCSCLCLMFVSIYWKQLIVAYLLKLVSFHNATNHLSSILFMNSYHQIDFQPHYLLYTVAKG